jgi:hypothetical protein
MCWKILHDLFENNSTTKKILLKNKLNSFPLEEDGLVCDYLNQIRGVLNQLTSISVSVANSELIIQILSTLPDSWEVFANNLMYRIIVPSFTKLTTMMLQEELRREIKTTQKVEHEGLNVNHYSKCND